MNDAFLQDAMDGYDAVQENPMPAIQTLEKRVAAASVPTKKRNVKRIAAWTAAAVLVLLLGTQALKWFTAENALPTKPVIAVSPVVKPDSAATETPAIIHGDHLIADNTPKHITHKKPSSAKITSADVMAAEKTDSPALEVAEVSVSAFKTYDTLDKKYASAISSLKTNHLQTDSSVLAFKSMNEHLSSLNENQSQNVLLGKVAGVVVTQEKGKENNIRIRGISSLSTASPVKKVKGRLVDENGEAIIGGMVALKKGKTTGTTTNMNGEFELYIPKNVKDSLLVASYIGMQPKEFLAKENTGDVKLLADSRTLDEVVVIGYGVTKKKVMTGSVTAKAKVQTFGKKEFIQYFKINYDKEICPEQKLYIKVKFKVNEQGRPTDIQVLKTSCVELEEELKDWLNASPMWTKRNKTVKMTLKIKRK